MAVAQTNVTGRTGSLFSGLMALMVRMVENHPLARQVDELNSYSDEDLAAKGLTRQDALRHIFRDRYYI
ncbi:hypothetical protein SAMN05444722_0276 [Rhodovulum sp. ES.010]|uniref:hypothetical protein n=1 Tax=Rhodovulum sp. ES.010 TaxID=1882821 RepID=UPI00092BA1F8|nr:hypothetical protein [Rhodovulum sp. ES.010]SIO06134.1 hypothetical protein SAMN05444722_0276 [Rhodovulum sp. ES.010]